MGSRLEEATEEQLRKMLRLLGTFLYSDGAIAYYLRWAEGTQPTPVEPRAIINHMETFGKEPVRTR